MNRKKTDFLVHGALIAAVYVALTMMFAPISFGPVLMDVICGSIATLIGAAGSYALRHHKRLVCLPPILANTLIIPWVLRYAYGSPDLIPFMMLTVGIGEILAVGVLGNGLLAILERYKYTIFRQSRA